jgi:NADPH:quinone reductase-like Zn-dependent oxidoreductase
LLVAGVRRWGAAVERFEVADSGPVREGEVLIEVRAARVGYWDEAARKGEWDLGRGALLRRAWRRLGWSVRSVRAPSDGRLAMR